MPTKHDKNVFSLGLSHSSRLLLGVDGRQYTRWRSVEGYKQVRIVVDFLVRTTYASCVPSASTVLMFVVMTTHFLLDGCMSTLTDWGGKPGLSVFDTQNTDSENPPALWSLAQCMHW